MRLFHYPQTCSMASHIVLEETGADYDLHTVNLAEKEHLSPEYLRINPKGKIPALATEGAIITENAAIHYYLAKRFPEKQLCPRDPLQQAHWISLGTFISNSLHVAGGHITVPYNFADDQSAYPAMARKGQKDYASCFRMLDERLDGQSWLIGDQFTTVDAYLMPYVAGFERFGIPLSEYPNLIEWARRMIARPAVRRALEDEESIILQMSELAR